jgi:hypothetical protein
MAKIKGKDNINNEDKLSDAFIFLLVNTEEDT